jgi:hypothetical protein
MNNKQNNKKSLLVLVLILIPVLLVGQELISDDERYQPEEAHLSSVHQGDKQSDHSEKDNTVVWAINVGGSEYVGVDGISYQADQSITTGDIGTIENIKGSQDSFIYQSFRFGNIGIKQPMENGLYDIIFKFAEPEDNAMDARVFNVFAENKLVISDLNVRLARDGKHISALARAVYSIEVTDGQLDINFEAINGQPILNALIVRKKNTESKQWQLVWSDEFNYQGKPDLNKWSYDIWPARKVNSEDQTYTDSLKNVHVKDGNLVITAYKENLDDAKYTSGRIHSQGKGDFL